MKYAIGTGGTLAKTIALPGSMPHLDLAYTRNVGVRQNYSTSAVNPRDAMHSTNERKPVGPRRGMLTRGEHSLNGETRRENTGCG